MTSTIETHGSITEVTSQAYSIDVYGIVTLTITETVDYTQLSPDSSDISGLPDNTNGTYRCTSASIVEDGNGIGRKVTVYQGCDGTTYRYRLSSSTSQEPIQTHLDWDTKIGGSADSPLNNAIFKGEDSDSEFDYFPADADEDMGGVSGFLDMALECEVTVVAPSGSMGDPTGHQSYNNMAEVGSPIGGGAPPPLSGRDWLLVGSNQEAIGGAMKSTFIYRMSGEKGWNRLIYT